MAWPASRVSRVVMTGPLAPFAGVYELELRRRRYTPLAVVNQLRQVARLSHWLETNGLAVAALTGERVEEFLALQRASGRYRAQWSRPGLLCLPRSPAATAPDDSESWVFIVGRTRLGNPNGRERFAHVRLCADCQVERVDDITLFINGLADGWVSWREEVWP